jgi:sulfopyruvate decarboxylase subunit alpha
MVMCYRGQLGENNWWAIPHGMTMEPLLQAMRIPYRIVEEASAIRRAVAECYAWSYASYYHSALVLGGSVVR